MKEITAEDLRRIMVYCEPGSNHSFYNAYVTPERESSSLMSDLRHIAVQINKFFLEE